MSRSFSRPVNAADELLEDAGTGTQQGPPEQSNPGVPPLARGLVWSDLVAEMNEEHEAREAA